MFGVRQGFSKSALAVHPLPKLDACKLQNHVCARMQDHLSLCLHELKQAAYNQLQLFSKPGGAVDLGDEAIRALLVKRLLLLQVS